jgi:outer membrane protein
MAKNHSRFLTAAIHILCSIGFVQNVLAETPSVTLTLENAMNMSENHAYSVHIAGSAADVADGQKKESIRQFFPNVSVSGMYEKYDDHVNKAVGNPLGKNYGFPDSTVSTGSVTLTQPLVGLIPLYLSLQTASAKYEAALNNTKQSKVEARLLGANSFINAVKAIQLAHVAETGVKVAQTQLHDGVAQFNAGKLTNADVLKFKLNLENANSNLIQAQTTARITLVTLAEVVGISDPDTISLPKDYSSKWENKQKTAPSLEEGIHKSLSSRPEILSSKSAVIAANENKKLVTSSYLPAVNFVANYSRNFEAKDIMSTTGQTVFGRSDIQDNFFYGVTLNWNLLDWGVRQAQIGEAVAGESSAQNQEEQAESQIRIEVTNNYLKLQDAYQNLGSAKVSLEYAKDVFLQMEAQFNNGQATTTDVLSASSDQTSAMAKLANATGDLDIAWLDYQKSIGNALTTQN